MLTTRPWGAGTEKPKQCVDGRRFVQSLRTLINDYGNIDDKFLNKVDAIAKESEIAARDIFGLEEKVRAHASSLLDMHKDSSGLLRVISCTPWMTLRNV